MKSTVLLLLASILSLLVACDVRADVKMPAIFGDHMVLQQEATLPIWGWADAGEKVTVTVGTESASATAGADGKWMVKLPPLPNGAPPTTMTVAGKNTITFSDVLVGDVWVCSGQSNMQLELNASLNATTEEAKANDPQLRLFYVPQLPSIQPLSDMQRNSPPGSMGFLVGSWMVCTPAMARSFTAVGYYFGRDLRTSQNRPVGLIQSAWNGTHAEAWTNLSALQKEPSLKRYVDSYNQNVDNSAKIIAAHPELADYPAAQIAFQAVYNKWLKDIWQPFLASQGAWPAADAKAKAAGQPEPPKPVAPPLPRGPQDPSGGPGGATNLYNGMIAPLIPYAIKGVIWYQGESNIQYGMEYRTLFPTLITGWREQWGQGDFPFLFVQIATYGAPPKIAGGDSGWAILRESQLKTLSLPNTGMAVTIDIGIGDYHSPDKLDVGHRLALAAQHVAYGENLVYTGPIYDSMTVEGATARIAFKPDSIGSGLIIGSSPWTNPKATIVASKTELQGFEIAGDDKKWAWADAKIDGTSVVVSSPQVANPVAVRYAWADNPICNLYNKEGLPASPFRTDTWGDPPPPAPAVPTAK